MPTTAAMIVTIATRSNAMSVSLLLGADGSGGLQPRAYLSATALAAIGGAVGWHLVNRRARQPAQVMRWLAPVVLRASFLPAILVGFVMGWLTAGALMLMHVTTIVIAVTVYSRFMRLHDDDASRNPEE